MPRLALGAGIPTPIKLKNASVKIACGTRNVRLTTIGPAAFGKRWVRKIRRGPAPASRDARTNSRSLIRITSPLTMRAVSIQPDIQSPTRMLTSFAPSTIMIRITYKRDGTDATISAIRIRILSAVFPAYPDTAPYKTPSAPFKSALASPTHKLILTPHQTRTNRSLPNLSVPKGWEKDIP